jgi:uncharacterized membrane protein YphA (DoxX/SURF4 family)
MLNPFPDLLTYSMFAPFLLRVIAGLIFINIGSLAFRSERRHWLISFAALKIPKPKIALKIFGILEIALGAMLVAGFYTQVAALVLAISTLAEALTEYRDPGILKRNFTFYLVVLVILLSLLLTGAGSFAFDLPL